ncbi:DoxX family protein [Mucilaginibacter flavidus]|uniref:DoxX family protein n=1 Tax=Mucilaginibacter flavidus TaxID=2949309 RepID=UPI002092276E|nr:DoxX family protein [Mucilaginibacter flavidus]MCO5948861.1 DoxX family protein [Mucilaginibacter flavidus]
MSDVYRNKPVVKTNTFWDVILLILRVWFGYVMMKNGKVFFELFASNGDRQFFESLFVGNNMRFPLPLIIAFEAKGAEFFGGLFVFLGLFTRFGAGLVALTILIITLTANVEGNKTFDGTIAVSFCLFAIVFMYWGGGKYTIDSLFKNT